MSKIRSIISIIYCVLRRPEDILEAIQGKSVAANELGGGKNGIFGAKFIRNPGHIFMGTGSSIGNGANIWVHDSELHQGEFTPADGQERIVGQIIIGDNVRIGQNIKIDCYERVEIEDNCLLASDICIIDSNHGTGIEKESYVETAGVRKPVRIGKGSWIGERVCILAGANIGEKCIIGTNAVVTGNIPDYSIAVGIPARVIKTYNMETGQWEKVN